MKFKNTLPLLALLAAITATAQAPFWTVDFVKTQPGRRAEMLFFLENNWKVFRDTALARRQIAAYQLLESQPDSAGNFDFILLTAYPDSVTWQQMEPNFQKIMKTLRPDGPLWPPSGLKMQDFREHIFYKDATTVFAARSPIFPKIKIERSAEHRARLAEIDRDIWRPFVEAYASGDAAKYAALHTPDFIRATIDEVQNLEDYRRHSEQHFARNLKNGRRCEIAFTFFERVAGTETASERGIYRYTSVAADGGRQHFFGKFHVFHRRVGGVWKIAVDYDSDEDGTVGEADFWAGEDWIR